MILLRGQPIAEKIQASIREQLQKQLSEHRFLRPPQLVAILTTDHPASRTYVARKVKACHEVGMRSRVITSAPKSVDELVEIIRTQNDDDEVDGILVQLPLPDTIRALDIMECLDPSKDVDGLHPLHVGRVLLGDDRTFFPCTPLGICHLLDAYDIDPSGKHVVIVGRSNIVGKPLAAMLMQPAPRRNATVTVAHSHTKDLAHITRQADILIVAIGRPEAITEEMVKPGAVVVDVGINKVPDSSARGYRLVGDVDFAKVSPHVSAITPVPGGVGPMTIAMLLHNTFKAFCRHVTASS